VSTCPLGDPLASSNFTNSPFHAALFTRRPRSRGRWLNDVHKSPTSRTRSGIVNMVKSSGLAPSCNSSHVNGAETPANALRRALYGADMVLPACSDPRRDRRDLRAVEWYGRRSPSEGSGRRRERRGPSPLHVALLSLLNLSAKESPCNMDANLPLGDNETPVRF
jgi:hypothetical protein